MTPTSSSASLVLLLCGAAVLIWPNGSPVRRLETALTARRRTRGEPAPDAGVGATARAAARGDRLLLVAAPAAVVLLVAPEMWWLLLIAVGLILVRLRRSGPRRHGDSRRSAALAVHHELLAACLDAGMPIGAALRAVADAVPRSARPTGDSADQDHWAPLDAVAAMLELGADPDSAWAPVDGDPELEPLAAAARRSALGGAGLSDAVRDQARSLRSQVQVAARRATGRAGVLMVAPLGLCFLPAFLCLGLAPVVLALLGQLHLF